VVEHCAYNAGVGGSNPSPPTRISLPDLNCIVTCMWFLASLRAVPFMDLAGCYSPMTGVPSFLRYWN
jgi:hypothetical protein